MESLKDPEQLTDRLVQVAPLSNEIVAIDQGEDGTWALGFDDNTQVLMEWASQPERIVLSAAVGVPPPERTAEVLTAALSFTALWRESGGAKLAKGGDDGELMLIREIHSDLEGGWDLLPVLEHFSHVAAWWHSYVTQPAGNDSPIPFGREPAKLMA